MRHGNNENFVHQLAVTYKNVSCCILLAFFSIEKNLVVMLSWKRSRPIVK